MKRKSEKCEDVGNFMKKVFECFFRHFLKKIFFVRIYIQNFYQRHFLQIWIFLWFFVDQGGDCEKCGDIGSIVKKSFQMMF